MSDWGLDDNPNFTCPWPSVCRCTHQGCTAGWIDVERNGTQYAVPCPTCRPEVARALHTQGKSTSRKIAELRTLPRPSRSHTPEET